MGSRKPQNNTNIGKGKKKKERFKKRGGSKRRWVTQEKQKGGEGPDTGKRTGIDPKTCLKVKKKGTGVSRKFKGGKSVWKRVHRNGKLRNGVGTKIRTQTQKYSGIGEKIVLGWSDDQKTQSGPIEREKKVPLGGGVIWQKKKST